jgi:NADH-quinone oxidoreductase subunit N
MSLGNLASLSRFLPELILSGAIVLLVVVHAAAKDRRSPVPALLSLVAVGIALLFAVGTDTTKGTLLFDGMVALDGFGVFFKGLTSLAAIFVIVMSVGSAELKGRTQAEYYVFLLTTLLGTFLLATATDIVMVYIALELVSIPSYLLAGYLKGEGKSNEAAMKYVVYGAVASGVMIYGFSILYGLTGVTGITEMGRAIAAGGKPVLALAMAAIMVAVGFGYKIAAVPFHMWSPDVYEGSPTPVTAYFSVAPKAAGFAVLCRFFYSVFAAPDLSAGVYKLTTTVDWTFLFAVLSAVTMTVGNLTAIHQKNVKRLLAFSSIAHAGYMLMAFVLLTAAGIKAILFYLVTYLFMNLGAFYVVMLVGNHHGNEDVETFRGLGARSPYIAVALSICLFSLTGLPPFSGFIGKVYVFSEVLNRGLYWLAVVGALNGAISLYYYCRIVKAMFLDKCEETAPVPVGAVPAFLVAIFAVPTLLLGIYWEPVARIATAASNALISF